LKIKKSHLITAVVVAALIGAMTLIPTEDKPINVNTITLKKFQKLPLDRRMELLKNGAPRNVAHVRQKEIVRVVVEKYVQRWKISRSVEELLKHVHLVDDKEFKKVGRELGVVSDFSHKYGFTVYGKGQTYIRKPSNNSPESIFVELKSHTYHELTHLLGSADKGTIYRHASGMQMHPAEFRLVNNEWDKVYWLEMGEAAVEAVAMYTASTGEKFMRNDYTDGATLFRKINKKAGISPEEFREMVVNSRVFEWFEKASKGRITGIEDIEAIHSFARLFRSSSSESLEIKEMAAKIILEHF